MLREPAQTVCRTKDWVWEKRDTVAGEVEVEMVPAFCRQHSQLN